jgi:hypothetical protein
MGAGADRLRRAAMWRAGVSPPGPTHHVEHRTRRIEGFPEPTWEGVLRRRAEFPPWTDERLTIDSVHPRAANLQTALEYLSAR